MRGVASVASAAFVACCLAAPGAALAQGRAGSDSEEQRTLDQAEAAFNANRYEEASSLYEKVSAINPARPEAWVKRAVILYRGKKYTEAVKLLRTAQQTLPGDLGIKAQLGLSLYRSGATEMAVAMMEEVLAERPDSPELQLQLAIHYVLRGDGKKAVPAIEAYFKSRSSEAAGKDAEYWPIAGTAYFLNQQYDLAQKQFEAVLRQSPNDAVALASLGQVAAARGDCQKAIAQYEKVIAEAAKKPFIHADLASCYLKLGRHTEALRSAQAYAAARPKEARGQLLVGDARAGERDWAGAVAAWGEARRLDPKAPVDARLGRALLAQKNYPAALSALEQATALAPDDLELHARLTEAMVATRQPKPRLAAAGERLAKATDPELLTIAGVAFYAAEDDARATRLFESALALDPKARRARSGLAMALGRGAQAALAKDDFASAEASLRRAQQLEPDSLPASRNLALILLLARKYAEAENSLAGPLKKVPHDLVVNRLLGRALVGEKRRDDALRAYEVARQTAERTRGPALAEVAVELAPLYLDAGRYDEAVSVLEVAIKEAGQSRAGPAAARNLAIALYRRGLWRLGDAKTTEGALEDLQKAAATPKPALSGKEIAQVSCAAALAAIQLGKTAATQEALARALREGGCALKAPYDKLGLEFLGAYAQYREPQGGASRDAAARTFQKLLPKAPPLAVPVLRDLVRSSEQMVAYDLYLRGDEKRAAATLRAAARIPAGEAGDRGRELEHNLAVVDMIEGHFVAAEKTFEGMGARPPEAMVNLGILVDRQGDPKRALDLYKRALERGARAPRVREWVDVKERLLQGSK